MRFRDLAIAVNKETVTGNLIEGLYNKIEAYQAMVSALQEELDKTHNNLIVRLADIGTAERALWAQQTYGREWFADLKYSDSVVMKIAQALDEACAPLVGSNPFWRAIAAGNFNVIFLTDEEESDADE